MAADQPTLLVEAIRSGYGELVILDGVDLALPAGSVTAVIGANGAGKSTLLKTVFGAVQAQAGRIVLGGVDVTGMGHAKRLRAGIVLVPQGRCNFPLMTIEENLKMAAFTRSDRRVRDDIAAQYDRFSVLGTKRRVLAGNMSGGEQQLLEIAMALMLHPTVVLIDEPSLGLSPLMQDVVFSSVKSLAQAGTSVLMVEQNAVQALAVSDRGVVIERGKVSQEGSGVEMLNDPAVRRSYLGLDV